MLRAYRAVFMGAANLEGRIGARRPISARTLRLPMILLIAATLVARLFSAIPFVRLLRADFRAVRHRDRSMIPAPLLEIAVLVFGTDPPDG